MFALARSVSRVVQARNLHIVASPPVNRVGIAVKVVHMSIMVAAMLGVPMYVSVNFKHYRGDEK